MKHIELKSLAIIAIFLFATMGAFAQKGQGRMNQNSPRGERFMNIPDLTDSQKTQLKQMRTTHMKEAMPLRNLMKEKEAHLQTISTVDNVNMNEVNKLIEEIGAIKLDLAKKRAAHRQAIRKILTNDQRVFFDMHSKKHHKRGHGMKGKRGRGHGNCR